MAAILLSHKNEIFPFVTWMDLEAIMLSEINQTKITKKSESKCKLQTLVV